MTEEKDNAIEIAVVKEQISGLREQHKSQTEDMKRSIDALSKDVKELVGTMNRGKGAFGFAMVLAAGMGGVASKVIDYFFATH